VDWGQAADQLIAVLRGHLGRSLGDRGLSAFIGELSTQSREFSSKWAAHNVKCHRAGRKLVNHPMVGEFELDYQTIELPADSGLSLVTCFAVPGSPSKERLGPLARSAGTDRRSLVVKRRTGCIIGRLGSPDGDPTGPAGHSDCRRHPSSRLGRVP
jgi:hypothetical protein